MNNLRFGEVLLFDPKKLVFCDPNLVFADRSDVAVRWCGEPFATERTRTSTSRLARVKRWPCVIGISWDMPKPCIVGKGFKDLCIFRKGSLLTISQSLFSDEPVLFSSSWANNVCVCVLHPMSYPTHSHSHTMGSCWHCLCFWEIKNGRCIDWVVPPPSNSHHQDYEPFLVGDPNLNPSKAAVVLTSKDHCIAPIFGHRSKAWTFGWRDGYTQNDRCVRGYNGTMILVLKIIL